jgi:peptidoglycan/xylan/chitin deacetylase (PgdA/CDA1 family)
MSGVQKQIINLTFHGIGDPPRELDPGEDAVWIGRDRYEAVLDEVRDRDDVRITFDDGNVSDLEIGLPALVDRGLTATFFVVAGRLDAPGFLAASHLRELAAAGMAVGSHGLRHVAWRGLDGNALDAELTEARDLLQDALGVPVREAACPFGAYDRRVVSGLRRRGYRHAYTSDRGAARPGQWLQARNTVTETGGADLATLAARRPPALLPTLKRFAKRWR